MPFRLEFRINFLAAIVVAAALLPAGARAQSVNTLIERVERAIASSDWAACVSASARLSPLIRKRSGAQSLNYAGTLHNEGMCLSNAGRYRDAAARLEPALQIKEQAADIASYLRSVDLLISVYVMLGRETEAMELGQRALPRVTAVLPPQSPQLKGLYAALGKAAQGLEQDREAESYFAQALAAERANPSPDPRDLADALNDLGDQYGRNGRFADGERLLQQALSILTQAYGANAARASNYAKTLNDLGYLYKEAGRFSDAEAAFRQALAGAREGLGPLHPSTSAAMGNLALVLNAQGRYAEAADLIQQSLAVYEKTFGREHPMVALALTNLAANYRDQGRLGEARALQQRAISIYEAATGPDSADVARAVSNLANTLSDEHRYDDAARLYRRALDIFERRFGADSVQALPAVVSYGGAALDSGRLDEAAVMFQRALAVAEQAYGPDHPALTSPLRGLGATELKRGNGDAARARFRRALAITVAFNGERSRAAAITLLDLAEVESSRNDWSEALSLLRRASAAVSPSQVGDDREADDTRLRVVYPALLDALWKIAGGQPDVRQTDEAFMAAQRALAGRTGAALSQMAARFASGNNGLARAVRRRQDIVASLASLDNRIVSELGRPQGRNDALIERLRAQVSAERQSLERSSSDLAREFPSYAELSSPEPMTVAQTQALLRSDEALVMLLALPGQSFAFTVTREGAAWRRIAATGAELEARVSHLRDGLVVGGETPFDLQASYELYRLLFGDAEAALANKAKWIVVPSGALTSLPPHVLVMRQPDPALSGIEARRKAAWLVREKATSVMPSVNSLRALRTFAKASGATEPFIGFGDPQFKRGGAAGPSRRNLVVGSYKDFYQGQSVDLGSLRDRLPQLPDTADELRAVARALGAGDLRLGRDATVTAVKTMDLSRYRTIEFATHALVAGEVSGLGEPALVLTLPDRPNAEDDGLLTASRVATLVLDADFVVLSACNTAAGNAPGAEALSGLARAFFYAGARALLVSHWPVDSEATTRLITTTLAEASRAPGIGRAEALRRAMVTLLDDKSMERSADPATWAPFVVVGEDLTTERGR